MLIFLTTLLVSLASIFRSRASLGLENLGLRHQIGVLQRSAGKRPKLTAGEVLSAPRSPWQRAYIERVIGSVRRECLDHMIVFHETSLRRTLTSYFDYYHRWRTHLSFRKDAPEPRAIHPPEMGSVVALPLVGGLHHRYERRAA